MGGGYVMGGCRFKGSTALAEGAGYLTSATGCGIIENLLLKQPVLTTGRLKSRRILWKK